jgi:murein DD-endopeptidase MepM/ murein hydrolase activator NlpD
MVSTGTGELTTWYAHMQALLVSDGEQVRAGQQIGVVGQRGNATGCHLHLEVHPSGGSIYQDNIDPSAWLRTVGIYPGEE